MKHLFLFLLTAGLSLMLSCKGDQGDQGLPGRDGVDGKDGNANVKSYTKRVEANQWEIVGTLGSSIVIPTNIITQDIVDQGMVAVYFKDDVVGEWIAWPYTVTLPPPINITSSYLYVVQLGQVELINYRSDLSPSGQSGFVRIVAISADGKVQNPDLDWNDFHAVEKRFNLYE
ncbi:MAG: hypothetical protein JNJ57_01070 [Saprospiraceae bacterium]|nr:hypothetical protein [Saprospiraceae bacterium]